jgi:hypothetical protein
MYGHLTAHSHAECSPGDSVPSLQRYPPIISLLRDRGLLEYLDTRLAEIAESTPYCGDSHGPSISQYKRREQERDLLQRCQARCRWYRQQRVNQGQPHQAELKSCVDLSISHARDDTSADVLY